MTLLTYTGQLADENCNLNDAENIGCKQYEEFNRSLPDGFYDTINHIVKPMTQKIRKKKSQDKVIDTGLIYSRAMVLLQTNPGQSEGLAMEDILPCELCETPPSLFYEDGMMRIPKSKSQLKNKLKTDVANRGITTEVVIVITTEVVIVDGSAIL